MIARIRSVAFLRSVARAGTLLSFGGMRYYAALRVAPASAR